MSSTAFNDTLERLNRLSVDRHTHAYEIAWDDPDLALRPDDPRLELPAYDPLSATDWYRSQPPEVRHRLALYRYAACMKIGWQFENLLQRGLLRYAMGLPNGTPEFRYLHHEIIEESEHTLMFQEFVNRSELPVRGMPLILRLAAELTVLPLARVFPELFFLHVLGGEEPVDLFQRRQLQEETHPLVERIMRIHVAEEARHVSYARQHLRHHVPRLGRLRRGVLTLAGPLVLGTMARLMLYPPGDMIREFHIPRRARRQAFRSPQGRQLLKDSVARIRKLWIDLDLVSPAGKALWRVAGIWDEPAAAEVAG
jgi:para-aminobenzoate N-oxygenase AurF